MVIERYIDGQILFWLSSEFVELVSLGVVVEEAGSVIQSWRDGDVFNKGGKDRVYYSIACPDYSLVLKLLRGDCVIKVGGKCLTVFKYFKDTLPLEMMDRSSLGSVFKLLRPETKKDFRRAVAYGTSSFIKPKLDKSKCCVVTYANDAGGWFDVFYKHYSSQLGGGEFIYVITPRPYAFRDFKTGGVIGINGADYDDAARSILVSGLISGLSGYFQWVITADVDELIFCDPRRGFDKLVDRFNTGGLPNIGFVLGFDVIQMEDESPFVDELPLFQQRRYGIANSGMCKPSVTNGSAVLDIGMHYCQEKPFSNGGDIEFLLFHLKYACTKKRESVERMVNSTSYSDDFIKTYASASVSRDRIHPGLKGNEGEEVVNFKEWLVTEFINKIDSFVKYDGERDIFVGKNFVDNLLIDFSNVFS